MFNKLMPWKRQEASDVAIRGQHHPIARFREELDHLWDRFLEDWQSGGMRLLDESGWMSPRVEMEDDEKEYVLHAELPGFEPEDIDVKVSGNVLTLQAEQKEEGEENGGNYHRYGSFVESFTLPEGVLADEIDARYHSGILELHMPKSQEVQSKRIEVKSA